MAKIPTAAFAQTPMTGRATVTGADDVTSTPANTVLIVTADATEGGMLTRLTAIPRADTITAISLRLFISQDGGTTKLLINSVLMADHAPATTTAIPVTDFGYTEDSPLRLEAGNELYVGAAVALSGGISFNSEWSDF